MSQLELALAAPPKTIEDDLLEKTCSCFFKEYLMDEYCNKVMRLLTLEHFSNFFHEMEAK